MYVYTQTCTYQNNSSEILINFGYTRATSRFRVQIVITRLPVRRITGEENVKFNYHACINPV